MVAIYPQLLPVVPLTCITIYLFISLLLLIIYPPLLLPSYPPISYTNIYGYPSVAISLQLLSTPLLLLSISYYVSNFCCYLSPFLMSLYPPSIHTHHLLLSILSVATIYPSSIAIYYPSIVTYLLLIHSHFPFISNFLLLLPTLSIHFLLLSPFNCNLTFYYYLSPFY